MTARSQCQTRTSAHDCRRINYSKRWSGQFQRWLRIHPSTVQTEVISVISAMVPRKARRAHTTTPHKASGVLLRGWTNPVWCRVQVSHEEPHNWIVSRSGMSGCAPRNRTRSSCRGQLVRSIQNDNHTLRLSLSFSTLSLSIALQPRSLAALRTGLRPPERPLAKTTRDQIPASASHRASPGNSFRLKRAEGKQRPHSK